jgi:NitT/TauT family transport system substrate-binding protein
MRISRRSAMALATAGLAVPRLARAEAPTVRIGIQYGLTYLPFAVVQHEQLLEKHARAAGLGELQVVWNRSAGGTTMNDALLSGNLDFAATGFPSFFILWSRGKGRFNIRALASYGATPLLLITRDPAVKTIADFTDKNKIAVPAVKSSIQAILLQMAAEKQFGHYDALDRLTLSRSHPDAMVAILSPGGDVDSDFSAPPYQYEALKHPEIHVVTDSTRIFGDPLSNGIVYLTERYHGANPQMVQVVNQALREALSLVQTDSHAAAQMYLDVTHEKLSAETVLTTLQAPGTVFDATPRGTMRFAEFMHKTGVIANVPTSWKDVFFPEAYDLPGS